MPGPGRAAHGGVRPFRLAETTCRFRSGALSRHTERSRCDRCGPPAGPSAGWILKACVFAQLAESRHEFFPIPPRSRTLDPWRRHTLRPRDMPPAHECFGKRHYPCVSGFGNKAQRRRENARSRPASPRHLPISTAKGRHRKMQLDARDRVPTRRLKRMPRGRAPAETRNSREVCARNPNSRNTEPTRAAGRAGSRSTRGRSRRAWFRDTAQAPMTAPRTRSRARRSSSRSAAATSISDLISACGARMTPVARRNGRWRPKNLETAMVCAVAGAARGRNPPCRITPDNCRYRE